MSSVRTPVRRLDRRSRTRRTRACTVGRTACRTCRQPRLEVVRGEHGVVADLAQAGSRHAPGYRHTRARGRRYCRRSCAAGRSTSAARPVRSSRNVPSSSRRTRGVGRYGHQALPHPDRAGPGTAAAMRRAERLVDVEVHHVEAGLAGLEAAHDGVEVGAVHVGQGARPRGPPRAARRSASRTGRGSTGW